MSIYTSLSGIQAAQTDLSVISHNLANVTTNGFKKSRTDFADVIATSVSAKPSSAIGAGVVVTGNRQQFTQGNLVQSQSSLDLAISGDGFFAIKPQLGAAATNFTRNGAFLVDSDRYVTDAKGGYLQVYPVDGSGAVVASGIEGAQSLRLPATSGTPIATTTVALTANLPGGSPVPGAAAFDRFDPASYNNSTQTVIYDAEGNPRTLTNYFRRETVAGPTSPTSTWSVYSFVGDQQLTVGGNPAITLTFDSTGALTAPTAATSFDSFTPTGSPNSQTIAFDLSTATQKALPFDIATRNQNGVAVGLIQGVSVDEKGLVKASFSNGDTQNLGQVVLATFTNPSGLRQLGNSYWSATGLSGSAIAGSPGSNGFGNLLSGTIERSNVDTTEELVALIAAQRAFQANAKALETDKQVVQTLFNIQ